MERFLALKDGTAIAASIYKKKIEVARRIVDNSFHTRVLCNLWALNGWVTFFSETMGKALNFHNIMDRIGLR